LKKSHERPSHSGHSGHDDSLIGLEPSCKRGCESYRRQLENCNGTDGDAKIQFQSEAHCDSHRLIAKPKTTRDDGQSEKPISTVKCSAYVVVEVCCHLLSRRGSSCCSLGDSRYVDGDAATKRRRPNGLRRAGVAGCCCGWTSPTP